MDILLLERGLRGSKREIGHLVDRRELVSRVEPHRTRLREESYTVRSTELSEYGSHEIDILMAYCLLTDMVKESSRYHLVGWAGLCY
ncbi:hypothetical protein CY34DRAFT_272242 [Suillus luteus UH-Slu-Lm8-n1]|uniref:Uncharacterized protein n=1 Tax=Suillus luteus UH-Slu-Lm8-n1 TaxID=930992 RepID=A0A0D0AF65_9AGAM|nr:hypothetical protein CY34DRAFT_272242 [Suillus luteus UH-Slu-Lm8-n1]